MGVFLALRCGGLGAQLIRAQAGILAEDSATPAWPGLPSSSRADTSFDLKDKQDHQRHLIVVKFC
jgi:hypothetical protein